LIGAGNDFYARQERSDRVLIMGNVPQRQHSQTQTVSEYPGIPGGSGVVPRQGRFLAVWAFYCFAAVMPRTGEGQLIGKTPRG
jgi:hypothetical protein